MFTKSLIEFNLFDFRGSVISSTIPDLYLREIVISVWDISRRPAAQPMRRKSRVAGDLVYASFVV